MLKTFSYLMLAISILLNAQAAMAKPGFKIYTPEEIKKLLGPYPAKGSLAEIQDFYALLKFQVTRTEVECEEAATEESATLAKLFAGENGPLTKEEAKRLNFTVLKHYAKNGLNIMIAKNTFKRPRPYLYNPAVIPCISKESSYAYPSGHATMARAFAHVLSEIHPERREAFFLRADEIGRNRVLGGVHHPSDIVAGFKFADTIAQKILKSESFVSDVEKLQSNF